MAYSLKPTKNTDLTTGVKRIAVSQISNAINEIDDDDLPRAEKVHQLRKRCKKVRGLVRLVRPGFSAYDDENAFFRDLAKRFSEIRDRTAFIEMINALESRFTDHLYAPVLGEARRQLKSRRADLSDEEVATYLSDARDELVAARRRVSDWEVDDDEADVLGDGMAKTYKRARKAMAAAAEARTPDSLHEWRKRVKYHMYHARLLKRVWPAMMEPWISEAKTLSDHLGDHHDDAVFLDKMLPKLAAPEKASDILRGLLISDMQRHEEAAFARGQFLLAEKPDAIAARFARYWTAARAR